MCVCARVCVCMRLRVRVCVCLAFYIALNTLQCIAFFNYDFGSQTLLDTITIERALLKTL